MLLSHLLSLMQALQVEFVSQKASSSSIFHRLASTIIVGVVDDRLH